MSGTPDSEEETYLPQIRDIIFFKLKKNNSPFEKQNRLLESMPHGIICFLLILKVVLFPASAP